MALLEWRLSDPEKKKKGKEVKDKDWGLPLR